MIKGLTKAAVLVSALTIAALPMSASFAADKPLSCKEQANQAGIKDKAERKQFMKDCKAKAKAAKGEAKAK